METELSIIPRIQRNYWLLVPHIYSKESIEKALQNNSIQKRIITFLVDLDFIFSYPKIILGYIWRDNKLFACPETLELSQILPNIRNFAMLLLTTQSNFNQKPLVVDIVNGIDTWNSIADALIKPFQTGNWFLKELPQPPSDQFNAFVKELNPKTTLKCKHPFNETQLISQRKRNSEELLINDPVDPITGARFFRHGDGGGLPGSGIFVDAGHHRLYELYRRYLRGELSGDKLILFRRAY